MIFRVSVLGGPRGGGTPKYVKMFASKICTDIKNTGIENLVGQKFDFWGSTLRGPPDGGGVEGGTLKLCQNICLLSIC